MKFQRSIDLLRKYLLGKARPEETEMVERWYAAIDKKQGLRKQAPENTEAAKAAVYERLVKELKLETPILPLYKRAYFRWSAAAVLILLAAGPWLFFLHGSRTGKDIARASRTFKHDIAPPALNKATLTLADGTRIELDSSRNGTLAAQGKTNIIKQGNELIAYQGKAGDKIMYNTLSVPRGSKPMKISLADGTSVWVNVASSITFPTAFSGKERRVEIKGEVYFEVAKNREMPFLVKKAGDDAEIKVLGTHFNVNAYDDEQNMKVTLLEGAVDVSKGNSHSILKPGEQAQVSAEKINVIQGADIDETMAWKDGRFYFDGSDIKTIMRQVEKWYNVEVVYESPVKYSFIADISRDVNVSELLKILQFTELVHFKVEENKITVMK